MATTIPKGTITLTTIPKGTIAVIPSLRIAEEAGVEAADAREVLDATRHRALEGFPRRQEDARGDPEMDDRVDRPSPDRLPPRGLVREAIGFHITLRLADNRPIATTLRDVRLLARVVQEQGEQRGLVAFGAADDHLHAALVADRATAGAFAHYVETSLRWRLRLGVPFEAARIRPLTDQRHAYNTFHYVHRQDARHKLERDPAREATSLPDLLGMRVGPTTIARRVRAHLPRIGRMDMLAHFPAGALSATTTAFATEHLVDAASAAFALPDLRGRCLDAYRARRAVVHAAGGDVGSGQLAEHLGIGVRAVQTMRGEPIDAVAVRAVVLQARLRATLHVRV